MKKAATYMGVIVVLILVFGLVACDNTGGSIRLSGYYIYAKIGDTDYEWKLGFTNVEDDAFGIVEPGAPDTTWLLATPDIAADVGDTDNFVMIVFEGTTTGTYSMSDVVQAGYSINGLPLLFTDITLVVTTYEDVGGVIKGTFSGTVEDLYTNTTTVENGQFNVIHAETPPIE
jgi:hypothetical protein